MISVRGETGKEVVGLIILGFVWFVLGSGSSLDRLVSALVMVVGTAAYFYGMRIRRPDFFSQDWMARVGFVRAVVLALPLLLVVALAGVAGRAL